MKKKPILKSIFPSVRLISNLSLVILFSLQSSAEAFSVSVQLHSLPSAQYSQGLPLVNELDSVSDAALLQKALLPIEKQTGKVASVYLPLSHGAVSISTFGNRYRQVARFIFSLEGRSGGQRYQAYELNPGGRLGRVIETGDVLAGEFIRERIYDYKAGTVVLYNPKNVFEKRIYELQENGEPGRPVQYRGRSKTGTGDLISVNFLYQADTVTCLNMKNMSYSVYEFLNGVLGPLREVGNARSVATDGALEKNHHVLISNVKQSGISLPVYIFREADGVTITRERIGGDAYTLGSMGRVLRYVSSETDLEYFYQEAVLGADGKVTVLNHLLGETLTFEIPGKDLTEESGRINPMKEAMPEPLTKAVSSISPVLMKESWHVFWTLSESDEFPIYIRLNDEVLIWEKLLRGPPAFYRDLLSSVFLSALFSSASQFSSALSDYFNSTRVSQVPA